MSESEQEGSRSDGAIPVAWVYNLNRKQLVQCAKSLSIDNTGTVAELRARMIIYVLERQFKSMRKRKMGQRSQFRGQSILVSMRQIPQVI